MMNITKNKLAEKVGVLMITLLSFCWLTACVASPPQPPISIPFAVHQKGSKIETEFVIKEDATYAFSLRFMCKKDTPADCDRVKKLVGSNELDLNKNPKDYGIPIPLTLKVIQLDDPLTGGEQIIADIKDSKFILTSWGQGYSKTIRNVSLIQGHYRVVVTGLEEIKEFKEVQVKFLIVRAYLGK